MAGRFRITTLGGTVVWLDGGVFRSRDDLLEYYLNLTIRLADMDETSADPEVQMIEKLRELLPRAEVEEVRPPEDDPDAIY